MQYILPYAIIIHAHLCITVKLTRLRPYQGDWLNVRRSLAKTWLYMIHQFVFLLQSFRSIL